MRKFPDRTRAAALATGIAVIGITSVVDARTGDNLREGLRNGTTTSETEIVSNIAAASGLKGGYSTRQSNLSATGGGAIYGCRSAAGGSAATPPQNPCVRANNLSTGYAFEFNATRGDSAGSITVGAGGDTKKPFTTNATGVATGLNADRVDGASAEDIVKAARTTKDLDADRVDGAEAVDLKSRWVLVKADGTIEEQSGGFKVIQVDGDVVYIDAGSSLDGKGLDATIAALGETGEISAARCGTPAITCIAAADNKSAFAVTLADSAGVSPAVDAPARRFYASISE